MRAFFSSFFRRASRRAFFSFFVFFTAGLIAATTARKCAFQMPSCLLAEFGAHLALLGLSRNAPLGRVFQLEIGCRFCPTLFAHRKRSRILRCILFSRKVPQHRTRTTTTTTTTTPQAQCQPRVFEKRGRCNLLSQQQQQQQPQQQQRAPVVSSMPITAILTSRDHARVLSRPSGDKHAARALISAAFIVTAVVITSAAQGQYIRHGSKNSSTRNADVSVPCRCN